MGAERLGWAGRFEPYGSTRPGRAGFGQFHRAGRLPSLRRGTCHGPAVCQGELADSPGLLPAYPAAGVARDLVKKYFQ